MERLAQPNQKSSQRVTRSTKAKGVVLSVMGSAAKATCLLRICRYPFRHAISRTVPFRKSGRTGNCFGLLNTAFQTQGCNNSSPGCCQKRKGGRSWPTSEHFAPHIHSLTLLGPSASRGTASVAPSMRRRRRASPTVSGPSSMRKGTPSVWSGEPFSTSILKAMSWSRSSDARFSPPPLRLVCAERRWHCG